MGRCNEMEDELILGTQGWLPQLRVALQDCSVYRVSTCDTQLISLAMQVTSEMKLSATAPSSFRYSYSHGRNTEPCSMQKLRA
jgi:hypothetical protein